MRALYSCRSRLVLLAVLLAWLPAIQAFQPVRQPKAAFLIPQGIVSSTTTSSTTSSRSSSARHATFSPQGNSNNGNGFSLSTEQLSQEVEKEVTRRNNVWLLPPTLSATAYVLYDDTSRFFHTFLSWVSGHNWVPADGGKYVAEITKSALTGPVTFSVSILFGSLVGLTISTLNARQVKLKHLFFLLHEEGQGLQQLLEECPPEIQQEGLALLTRFMHRLDQTLRVPDKSTDAALRTNQELQDLTQIFHQRGSQIFNDMILAEIYANLGRIKACRAELWSAYTNNFSVAHYTNMIVLASALLFIFLLETDNGAMQFLIDFQLSICWALLIGAYSLLAAIIVDLRGIPPQLSTRLDQNAIFDE